MLADFPLDYSILHEENKGRNGIVQEAVILWLSEGIATYESCCSTRIVQTELGHTELTKRKVAIAEHRQLLK